jgi:N-acetylneuraminate synthase
MAFDFSDLFVLEVANNHQGDEAHGLKLIQAHGEVVKKHGVRAAFKFQLRDLSTFIHPAHQQHSTLPHVKRFQSTALPKGAMAHLVEAVRAAGCITMCTPFDEASVKACMALDFEVLKVGSCSARDWPLLEAMARTGRPVICSTGGLGMNAIDDLVSFFQHRGVHFALMHCVSLYPTPPHLLELSQIKRLRRRFPTVPIGFSTHEDPDNTQPIKLAYAYGAQMFERHVGLPSSEVSLNAYSSTPQQLDAWLAAFQEARDMAGDPHKKRVTPKEEEALRLLERGVFAQTDLVAEAPLSRERVYFAFPRQAGQLTSGEFKEGCHSSSTLGKDDAILADTVTSPQHSDLQLLKNAVHDVKAMLNEAGVVLDSSFTVNFSHHQGVGSFRKTGAVLISCFNRAYCKKIVVQLPGQEHPLHYHRKKEETFQVLSGVLHVELDEHLHVLYPGQTLLIQRGVFHRFWTETGTVFEEVSTHEPEGDSVYQDPLINDTPAAARKTEVDNWGRFSLQEKLS